MSKFLLLIVNPRINGLTFCLSISPVHYRPRFSLLDSYDSVKEILLEAMGDTASQAARKWWTVVREPDESNNALYQKISTLNHRTLEPLGDNKQDILNFITLSKFLDLLPHACYNFVVSRQGREAAKLAMEFQQSQAKFKTSPLIIILAVTTNTLHTTAGMASPITILVSIHHTLLVVNP